MWRVVDSKSNTTNRIYSVLHIHSTDDNSLLVWAADGMSSDFSSSNSIVVFETFECSCIFVYGNITSKSDEFHLGTMEYGDI